MACAALYARHSDDKQNEVSIEDQFRLCREHAARERWQVVGSYEDAAISGASTILQPGIQRLMRDAQQGDFNILLAEALDRISRDQADMATLVKHLKFAGVIIVTLAEGEITELHVGLKGTMNALFLKDLVMIPIAPSRFEKSLRHFPAASRSLRQKPLSTMPPHCRVHSGSREALLASLAPRCIPARTGTTRVHGIMAAITSLSKAEFRMYCGGRLIDPMDEWDAEAVAAAMNAVLHPKSNRDSGG